VAPLRLLPRQRECRCLWCGVSLSAQCQHFGFVSWVGCGWQHHEFIRRGQVIRAGATTCCTCRGWSCSGWSGRSSKRWQASDGAAGAWNGWVREDVVCSTTQRASPHGEEAVLHHQPRSSRECTRTHARPPAQHLTALPLPNVPPAKLGLAMRRQSTAMHSGFLDSSCNHSLLPCTRTTSHSSDWPLSLDVFRFRPFAAREPTCLAVTFV
jgi:hypothetical protein